MSIMKKVGVAAAAVCLTATMVNAVAAPHHSKKRMRMQHQTGVEGFGIGTEYTNLLGSGFGLSGNYVMHHVEMGLSMNWQGSKEKGNDAKLKSEFDLGAYLGYLMPLSHAFYASMGVQGEVAFLNKENRPSSSAYNPYAIGGYVGLSYEPTNHVQIFARINPITFTKTTRSEDYDLSVFETGTLGVNYFFG